MPTLKLSLDPETYEALSQSASSHLRPPDWHAEALLRHALGLPFPYPAGMTRTAVTPPPEPTV